MDTFFLVTDELGWEKRFQENSKIFENLKVVFGEDSILKSINKCKSLSTTDRFVLVDGDTVLLPEAASVLQEHRPSVWYARNYLGLAYGHGGLKILDRVLVGDTGSIADITSRMGLITIERVVSEHQYNFSEFNTWKTEFKELLKLYLWGDSAVLPLWLSKRRGREVMSKSVVPFIRSTSLRNVASVVHDSAKLKELYLSFCGEDTDT